MPLRGASEPSGGGLVRALVPGLLAIAATLAYGLLGSQQFRNLVARSWDLGIFTQLARAYAELRAPIVPIKGDAVNLLGDHFHQIGRAHV